MNHVPEQLIWGGAVSDGCRPEYIAQLSRSQREELSSWLRSPNGALTVGDRVTFEAVEGGGVLVRVRSFENRRKTPSEGT